MEIRQYVKDKNNQKVGLVLATLDPEKQDEVKIGFSKCNTKHDKFDRNRAIEIARIRAKKYSDRIYEKYNVPFLVEDVMPEFVERCRRYYKEKKLPDWVRQFENLYLA